MKRAECQKRTINIGENEAREIMLKALIIVNNLISGIAKSHGFESKELLKLTEEYTKEMSVWLDKVEEGAEFPIQVIVSFNVLSVLAERCYGISTEVVSKACLNSKLVKESDGGSTELLKKIQDDARSK